MLKRCDVGCFALRRLPPRGSNPFEYKNTDPSDGWVGVFMYMGYKKDIFGTFAYDFELSHK